MGVYFPYMLVDVNGHGKFVGEGEHQTRKYYVGSGDKQEARYDADLYHVERDFDISISGLSVESNSDRLNTKASDKTNNIINSIMPFDTENAVKYNANYLKGYTSERRDTNITSFEYLILFFLLFFFFITNHVLIIRLTIFNYSLDIIIIITQSLLLCNLLNFC